MKKRILMVSSSSKGGGPKQLFLLSKELCNSFEISVACPENDLLVKDLKSVISGKLCFIQERKISVKDLFILVNFIRKNSIDVIHSHGKGASVLARISSLITGVPLIHTFHGVHVTGKGIFSIVTYLSYELLSGWIDSHKIFVSSSEKKLACQFFILPKTKCRIIPNGVCTDYQKESISFHKFKIRKELKLDQEAILVLTLCRLDKIKNLLEVIEIARLCYKLKFLILGDGPEKDHLVEKIKSLNTNNVSLIGHIENPLNYLKASDIYISSSFREGHPLSILEAMSVGLPVVASNVPGNCETIVHGNSGFYYDLGNIEEASMYLNQLSQNKIKRELFSQNAQSLQREKFSSSSMAKSYSTIYQEI